HVTGVQTCALPISAIIVRCFGACYARREWLSAARRAARAAPTLRAGAGAVPRSEGAGAVPRRRRRDLHRARLVSPALAGAVSVRGARPLSAERVAARPAPAVAAPLRHRRTRARPPGCRP